MCFLALGSKLAQGGEASDALAEAKVAMSHQPPDREAARAALQRAAAAAHSDPNAAADAFLGLGRLDRDERAYTRAIANYRACIAASPDTIWARRASRQIDWLIERSEGDFAPLERFERVELDPALMGDPIALEGLARDADAFPPGRVRIEARMFVAQAWLGKAERRFDAIRELRKVAPDVQSVDPLAARTVEREVVDALLTEKRVDEAAREASLHGDLLDPPFRAYVRRLGRRHRVLQVAIGELLAFAGIIALVAAKARRRSEPGATVGSLGRAGRTALVLGIGVSTLAAAFVLVDAIRPTYLDRLGL